MESQSTTTLTVRINGMIETPPANNRENFRQSVIETILYVLKTEEVDVEYIGYKPDKLGIHHLGTSTSEYEDCIYASLTVNDNILARFGETHREEEIIKAFVEAFENRTHRHLEVDSTVDFNGRKHRIIEMSSDWKLLLKQG